MTKVHSDLPELPVFYPDIAAVDLLHRQVVLNDNSILPIVHLIDEDGDETWDPAQAVTFVCALNATHFHADLVDDFAPLVRH